MRLIDLSQYLEFGMPVYPGDNPVKLIQSHICSRDRYNNHHLQTGMHVGTHLDGPMHMLDTCMYIGDLPLESFCGEACIINAKNTEVIKLKAGYEDIIRGKEVVLIHTGMDSCYGDEKYYNEHPVLDLSFCNLLVKNKIKMIGLDSPSPDRFPFEAHKYLLNNNVLILENLTNLDQINSDSNFEVIALPLKIKADSSMVRAVARVY